MIDRVKLAHLLYRAIMKIYGELRIGFSKNSYIFQPPLCGTFKIPDTPYISTLGKIIQGILETVTNATISIFTPPLCGDMLCGEYPISSMLGYIVNESVTNSTVYSKAIFNPPLCNTIVCGEAA